MTISHRIRKPSGATILAMAAALLVGQIAAACACVMQPGHVPVAEAAHQGHGRHDASTHCVDPCVVTTSAELTSQQVQGAVHVFEYADDAASSALVLTLADRDLRLGATRHAAYESPPDLPDTLVRLHTLLLT